jgi:hypothetical protein
MKQLLALALAFVAGCVYPDDMALPLTRERTYGTADPVRGVDINAIQDAIIGGKRNQRWRTIPPSAGIIVQGAPGANYNARWSTGAWIAVAANDRLRVPIVLDEGERLLEVRGYVTNGATDVITMKVEKILISTQANSQLGATQTSTDHAFALQTLTVTGLTETFAIATAASYSVLFEATAFANTPGLFGVAILTDIL